MIAEKEKTEDSQEEDGWLEHSAQESRQVHIINAYSDALLHSSQDTDNYFLAIFKNYFKSFII